MNEEHILETPQEEEVKNETLSVLSETPVFLDFPREEEITAAITKDMNIFQLTKLKNLVKSHCNVLHHSLSKKSNIFIFGAGGTTSWFLPKLLKIYNDAFLKVPQHLRYPLEIVLIDNDILEPKNIIRQNFIPEDIGQYKAEILSQRYSELYPNITVSFVNKYATYKAFDIQFLPGKEYPYEDFVSLEELKIRKKDILINLVDNEGFKKKLDWYIARRGNPLFSAGVNLYNGQAYYSNNRMTKGYVMDHADLLDIFDEVSIHSCADTDALGTDDNPEQLFNGNDVAASVLANLYQVVLTDIPLYKRINFTTGMNMSVNVGNINYSVLREYISLVKNGELASLYHKAKNYFESYVNNENVQSLKTKASIRNKEILDQYNLLINFLDYFKEKEE